MGFGAQGQSFGFRGWIVGFTVADGKERLRPDGLTASASDGFAFGALSRRDGLTASPSGGFAFGALSQPDGLTAPSEGSPDVVSPGASSPLGSKGSRPAGFTAPSERDAAGIALLSPLPSLLPRDAPGEGSAIPTPPMSRGTKSAARPLCPPGETRAASPPPGLIASPEDSPPIRWK